MKYGFEKVVAAEYTNPKGNPFLEAMPELLDGNTFQTRMENKIQFPKDINYLNAQERRSWLSELSKWFQPMDYMYVIYDMLYRAILSTYKTKTIIDTIQQIYQINRDYRNECTNGAGYSTQAYNGAILGVPGIGKTSTICRCLDLIPQVIIHTKYRNEPYYTKQINYINVECPADCSIKTLAYSIFASIDRAINSNYLKHLDTKALSASALTTKLKIVCLNHHVGLIVIDEIQNAIQTANRNKQTKPLIKFLLELTNETATGIVFCGTLEAEELFCSQEHLKRRTRGLRLLPLKYDAVYRRFIQDLWKNQAVLRQTVLTEKWMRQIYDLSGGIPAYIVKIIQEAQVQAILSGQEKLTYEEIQQAVGLYGIEVPKVYGRCGTSISDFSVQPIELEVLEEEGIMVCEKMGTKANDVLKENEDPEIVLKECDIKRFYALNRGRKRVERSQTDLIVMWSKNKEQEMFINMLDRFQMMERRYY